VDTGLPQPRNEEESILSYRMGKLEESLNDFKKVFENTNLTVLAYKVSQLEVWRNRIIATLTAVVVTVVGALFTGDIRVGGS
jgi:hypothetical protein